MSDSIEQFNNDLIAIARNTLGVPDNQMGMFLDAAKYCARTQGVAFGLTGAAAGAAMGTVMVPVIGSAPGWIVGALVGFVGGTAACMVGRETVVQGINRILSDNGKDMDDLRFAIAGLLNRIQNQSYVDTGSSA